MSEIKKTSDTKKRAPVTAKDTNLKNQKIEQIIKNFESINPAYGHVLASLFKSSKSDKTREKYQYLASQYLALQKNNIDALTQFRVKYNDLIVKNANLKVKIEHQQNKYDSMKSLLEGRCASKLKDTNLKYVKNSSSTVIEILNLSKHIEKNVILKKHFIKAANSICKMYDLTYYIPKKGLNYNPLLHKSINMTKGKIIETIKPGFKWRDTQVLCRAEVLTEN